MKIGDLVEIWTTSSDAIRRSTDKFKEKKGVIVGFNKKGEGGKDYVHVLIDGEVCVFMKFAIEVINEV
jgi:hypothetical protein